MKCIVIINLLFLSILDRVLLDYVESKEEINNLSDFANNINSKDNEDDTNNYFAKLWESKMSDYEYENYFTIKLNSSSDDIFYEEVNNEHIKDKPIKGAYIVNNKEFSFKDESISLESKPNITINIYQDNKIIYTNSGSEVIFEFFVPKEGPIAIQLFNASDTDIYVLFTISSGHDTIATKEHMDKNEIKINKILNFIDRFKVEKLFLNSKHEEKKKEFKYINKLFYTYTILESTLLFVVVFVQFYYIRSLFEIKVSF